MATAEARCPVSEPLPGEDGPVCLYEGDDIEELREVMGRHLTPHRLTVVGEQRSTSRFRVFHQGRVAFYDHTFGVPVRMRTEELPDFYKAIFPYAGNGRVVANGTALPSPLSIAGPGDRVLMEWDHGTYNGSLAISRRHVDQAVAARLDDTLREPVRFRHPLDDDDPVVRSWLGLVRQFREFTVSPLARRSELAVRHFEQLLIDGLLDAQPHSWSRPVAEHGRAVLPSALRRATDYCEEHAGEAVSVADIARAARVGLRGLREGFRHHLGTTPLAHLRRVRLDRAHHDLLAIADGRATGTVTDVALRWGFAHLGRFSAEYRRAYGHPPSETLRPRG
ncbi:AraC family transcriptional regulator [Kitasatospora sp. NPDC094028]